MVDKTSFFGRHGNTYIYVPNLIGYARVVCALFAFAVALRDPYYCVVTYFIGFVLDETDGRAARTFNQSSTLGAVLDMVTDRLATAGLLAVLGMLYPRSYMAFLSLMFLDIFSHWFQMYSTFVSGSSTHKDVKSRSWIVRTYYKHRMFMGVCCISCEVLYLSLLEGRPMLPRFYAALMATLIKLYALDWKQFREWPVLPVALPERLLRDLPDTAGLEKGLPLAAVTAMLSLPGFLVKQIINCFQLRSSMQALVQYDKDKEAEAVAQTAAKLQ